MRVYIPEDIIDDLIRATGFTQVAEPAYDIKYKCKWLLERIGILRQEATAGNILHDNPDMEKLVAYCMWQKGCTDARQQTINTMMETNERLRDEISRLKHQGL